MTEQQNRLDAALSHRYRIEHELGAGGMARVYLAHDVKHDREVAIKVLRPDLAASLGPDRFLREIQVAAKLNHPHILTLIDSGEADGLLYYVMPFVSGESLRARLNRERVLDPAMALAITRDVADALSYAHRLGVVHRDIKPENVLFSEGHALVTDFGIAKAVSSASGEPLTGTGVAVGTPGYMSPEQAAGAFEIDERTDVFSLACVAYEMLVGTVPGRWVSDDEVRQGRFTKAPPEDLERLRQLPSSVEPALARGMAIEPELRFETPRELADALTATRPPTRRYGDTEAQEMLGRAAAFQAEEPTSEGLSLSGVKRIAAEVDIPSRHVEAAARDLAQPKVSAFPPSVTRVLGIPAGTQLSRSVNGEVPATEFSALLEIIQETLGEAGTIETSTSNVFAWSTGAARERAKGRSTHVQVTVRDGRTKISVIEDGSGRVGAAVGMGALAAGMGTIAILEIGVLVLLPAVGVFIAGGIGSLVELGRRRRDLLNRLLDRLTLHVSTTPQRELPGGRKGRTE
jgi:serine/threonine protein kinase